VPSAAFSSPFQKGSHSQYGSIVACVAGSQYDQFCFLICSKHDDSLMKHHDCSGFSSQSASSASDGQPFICLPMIPFFLLAHFCSVCIHDDWQWQCLAPSVVVDPSNPAASTSAAAL